MATADRRPQSAESSSGKPARKAKGKRRWLRRLLTLAVVCVLLVYLAPIIIAKTPLRNTLLSLAIDRQQGTAVIQSASLGWFSPIEIGGLEVRDPHGNPIAAVTSIRSEKTLLNLATNQRALGTFWITAPQLHVHVRDGGSNLEDFAAPWLEPGDDKPGEPSAPKSSSVAVEIIGGQVFLTDATTGQRAQLDDLALQLAMSDAEGPPIALTASAAVAGGQRPARVEIDLKMPTDAKEAAPAEPGKVTLATEQLPLAMAAPLLARFAPETELGGELTAQWTCMWGVGGADKFVVEGEIIADQFVLAGPILSGDRLALKRLHVPASISVDGQRVTVHHLQAKSDVGELEAQGTFAIGATDGEDLLDSLSKESFEAGGRLDLARLAALLPATLHIRKDTQITSGQVELALVSKPDGGVHRWQGGIETSRLAAESGGRRLAWEQPVKVLLEAHATDEGVNVDQLICHSDFLQLSASGTPDKLSGAASYNLNELVEQLGQFVDLGPWQLAGEGQADFRWSRSPQGAFQASARLGIQDFQLAGPDRPPWVERQLTIDASATGVLDDAGLRDVRTAAVKVVAGPDQFAARLVQEVAPLDPDAVWPIEARLAGSLARWLQRAQPWMAVDDMQLDGHCEATASAAYSAKEVAITQAAADVKQLDFHGYGLNIVEPVVQVSAANARWDAAASRFVLADSTLATSAISLRAQQIAVDLPTGEAARLSGTTSLHGELHELQRWVETPGEPNPWLMAGTIAGKVQLAYAEGSTSAKLDLDGKRLRLLERYRHSRTGKIMLRKHWQEEETTLVAAAVYDEASDRLLLQSTRLDSDSLKLAVQGTIDALRTRQAVNLAGTLDYDLATVTPLLWPYLGREVKLVGRDTARFKIAGPMGAVASTGGDPSTASWLKELKAEASFGWQSADLYGLQVGPATIQSRLADSTVRFAPIDLAVSEGRLTTAPVVRFEPGPARLLLPKGPLIRQVRISPEMCNNTLKFVAPVLADATRTEGTFSIDLEASRVPLDDPKQADVGGRLSVHQMEVMPGPLAREVLLLSKQIEAIVQRRPPPVSLASTQRALLRVDDQELGFHLKKGRVYHDRLKMTAGNVVIQTRGSVGLDESLDLVAEIPFQDRWAGDVPALASLRGTMIEIGIRGTLRKPKVDGRPLEQLAKSAIRGAATRAITEGVNRQLDRLLQPRQ